MQLARFRVKLDGVVLAVGDLDRLCIEANGEALFLISQIAQPFLHSLDVSRHAQDLSSGLGLRAASAQDAAPKSVVISLILVSASRIRPTSPWRSWRADWAWSRRDA